MAKASVDDTVVAGLNKIDDTIDEAVKAGDQESLTSALARLHAEVLGAGQPVADDELEDSDLILPSADASVDEVRELLADSQEGLLPG